MNPSMSASMIAPLLSAYLGLQLMIVVSYLGLRAIHALGILPARTERGFHVATLGALAVTASLALAQPVLGLRTLPSSPAEIWSASSRKAFDSGDAPQASRPGILVWNGRESAIDAETLGRGAAVMLGLLLALGLAWIGRDLVGLARLRRSTHPLRRIGRVEVRLCDALSVPFSYWRPGRASAVIPTRLLEHRRDFRIALAHELQHHRQGDTRLAWALAALRALCAPNPFVHLWARLLDEVQELACDEALLEERGVDPGQYASCLVEAANHALGSAAAPSFVPTLGHGLARRARRTSLRKRIERMIDTNGSRKSSRKKNTLAAAVALAWAAVVATAAYASTGWVQDRRISLEEAQRMAEKARGDSGFPIVVNELVLAQLNRYLGTPDGRASMRESLERMKQFQPMVEAKIREHKMPPELMAVPITESGYKNLPQRPKQGWGAGIWMFIEPTARRFGLRVDDKVDERLKPELLTDAAMRMLKKDYQAFGDWHLSLLAYNMGDTAVRKAMAATGSRDAWALVRAGHENDKNYLPNVMAAVLILKNPELLK